MLWVIGAVDALMAVIERPGGCSAMPGDALGLPSLGSGPSVIEALEWESAEPIQ